MTGMIRACAVWAMVAWPGLALAQSIDTLSVHVGPAASGTRAFVARPTGKGTWPGVVLVHDRWGLDSHVREVATRLAREGYVAVAPDLYHGPVAQEAEQARELAQGLDDDRALSDLSGTMAWLRASASVGTRRIGIVGFGLGGGYALRLALRDEAVAATALFYGEPVTDPKALGRLQGPLQAHFGEEDDVVPVRDVDALRDGLRRAGKKGDVYVYGGAGHAFMEDARPTYHRDAARLAWARTLAFLQKTLKG